MRKINTDLPEYIFQETITALIDKIEESKEDSELPWNTFGGSVYAGQRFIDYLNTPREFKINSNTSGIVASIGTVALAFFDKTRGANQSDLMLHSVAGGSNQEHTNQFFYEAIAKKIDQVKFKEVTGFELKQVMLAKEDERINVWMTGKQAGYIGFFDETYDLLDKAASLSGKINSKELDYELPENIAIKYGLKQKQNKIENDMEIKDVTVEMLKSGNPTVYNAIKNEGVKENSIEVAKIMKYAKYDPDKAAEMIEKGEKLNVEHVEYFMEKKFNKTTLDNLETNSEGKLNAAKTTVSEKKKELTAEEKEKQDSLEELNERIGITSLLKDKK